ncbi:hypothetical protein [Roseovarius nitratireducens]|uniref:hypothetical protein n=1 Tax=Roseovarius nitratireducens TaxID=2044597 RepID=UPI000CE22CA0|nr:hypothetical protein [Roseovarius nitratireducens]
MRRGIIIAIVAAIIIVIAGYLWYDDQAEQARLEEQRTEEASQAARDEERALQEEAALEREEERTREDNSVATAEPTVADGDFDQSDGAADEEVPVVGDEITEGMIVVQSDTDEAVIMNADDNATGTEIVNDTGMADPATTSEFEGDSGTGNDGTMGAGGIDAGTDAATTVEPGKLLTPENFDRGEVLSLIDNSDQLTAERRSTLRALVEGASANPVMVDSAIESIRAALDLPPLN